MQWLTKLDFKILHSIQDLSCSTLDFLMPKITILGNGGILWVLIAYFYCLIPEPEKAEYS